MSRSKRKKPHFGYTTCESEKRDKQIANKRYRKLIKTLIKKNAVTLPQVREIVNVWDFGKDGKHYYYCDKKHPYMRK